MIHCVKGTTDYFEKMLDGSKTFEIRQNDRDYKVGDYLAINEVVDGCFTGRCLFYEITYIMANRPDWIVNGYVVMGLRFIRLDNATKVARKTAVKDYNTKGD